MLKTSKPCFLKSMKEVNYILISFVKNQDTFDDSSEKHEGIFLVIEYDLTPSKPLRVVCWVHKHRLYQHQCIASFFVPTVHKSARYEFQT